MEINFHGKRALVTGAGRGIGREVAQRLEKCGAKVIALSRTETHLKSLKEECPTIEIVVADVGKWDETKKAVENIGPVDLLVNNAAITSPGIRFGNFSEEEYDSLMNVNLKGAFNVAQVVANGMRSQGTGGSIVNVSSITSEKVFAETAVYSATKAAMNQMTRVMAVELGPHKIRVNSISPGVVLTDMIPDLKTNPKAVERFTQKVPLKRVSETSDVADTILYLLSDKAAMIHGANIIVDGGHSIA